MRYVYVLLTDTGTYFSKSIRLYTREPMNHASLSFDGELQELYSFGRKHPLNAFSGGFVKEKVWGGLIRRRAAATPCAVYRCALTADQYRAIRSRVLQMHADKEQYDYNLLGLFTLAFGFNWQRSRSFFCSQFVESMFQEIGLSLSGKPAALSRPGDFQRSPLLELVFEGDLRDYARQPAVAAAEAAEAHASGRPIHKLA